MIQPRPTTAARPSGGEELRKVFISRVHEVLERGYRELHSPAYAREQEPIITGDLARAMRAVLRCASAPDWADHFSVHDDPPVNDAKRKGKRRNRIDIGVEASTPRPGNTFSFEAKRLGPRHTVATYLGPQGLGCFLRGDYARTEDDAGMIAYMQSKDAAHWVAQIGAALRNSKGACAVDDGGWVPHGLSSGPQHLYRSTHARKALGRSIVIYHSLLTFTPGAEPETHASPAPLPGRRRGRRPWTV